MSTESLVERMLRTADDIHTVPEVAEELREAVKEIERLADAHTKVVEAYNMAHEEVERSEAEIERLRGQEQEPDSRGLTEKNDINGAPSPDDRTVAAAVGPLCIEHPHWDYEATMARWAADDLRAFTDPPDEYTQGWIEAWHIAHSPAACGHSKANLKDPKHGTPEYEGEETCWVCDEIAHIRAHPDSSQGERIRISEDMLSFLRASQNRTSEGDPVLTLLPGETEE